MPETLFSKASAKAALSCLLEDNCSWALVLTPVLVFVALVNVFSL